MINTNGVLFGANAQVNVGGLVASALDIESADFDNGVFVFANAGGDVVNQGSIVAGSGGTVALLGNEAVNAAGGSIVAPRGSVRSEEHTSELQSLMRHSYAVFCLTKTQKQQ